MKKPFTYIIMKCMKGFFRYKGTNNPKRYSRNLNFYIILNPMKDEVVKYQGRARLFNSYKQAKSWIDKRFVAEEL